MPSRLSLVIALLVPLAALADAGITAPPVTDPNKAVQDAMAQNPGCTASPTPAPTAPQTLYQASVPFDTKDMLCFANFDFSSTPGPLEKLASHFGACQGMVGLARAFKTRAVFHCDGKKTNHAQAITAVDRITDLQDHGCEGNIPISGFCNLRDFCAAYPDLFRRDSVSYNADLTLHYTLPHLGELKQGANKAAQANNPIEISTIYEELSSGKPAMLLFPYHVVLVTGMRIDKNDRGWLARFDIYDPNDNNVPQIRTVQMAPDLKSTIGEPPIFDVTHEPDGGDRTCDKSDRD